jgi:carboxyl-terminal processing protease
MTSPANQSMRLPLNIAKGAIATSFLAVMSVISPVSVPEAKATEISEDNPKAVLDEAWQLVHREYVDATFNQTDWLAARQRLLGRDYSSTEAAYTALREELQRLNDPYTRFLDPQEYAELSDQTAGEVSGIGIQLQRDDSSRDIYITNILPNSPADLGGLRVGDRILLVDGQNTERLSVSGVARLLRGEENSQVTLTYSRNNSGPLTVIITRARLELPTVAHRLREVNGYRIGYIRLDEFNGHATEQMVEAIESLTKQKADAFVLDLLKK